MRRPAVGILAYGIYLPWLRLQRAAIYAANAWFAPALQGLAEGERAAANWDEDAVTMAVEAGRDCLTGIDRTGLASLALASTTLPFADRLNCGIVKEALDLHDGVRALDVTGGQRAGTSALIACLEASAAQPGSHLCLASELRKARPASEAELLQGDAAAALLVGAGDPVARFLGAHSTTVDFVDHFRAQGARFDYGWESRWIREQGYMGILGGALREAAARLDVAPGAIDRLVIPIVAGGIARALARSAGIRPDAVADTLLGCIGDAGAAHPLLMLAAVLEEARPGEKILAVGFGQGCDVLLFETTEALPARARRRNVAGALERRKPDGNYLRFLFHRGLLELDRGMRAEQDQKQPGTTLFRSRRTVLGLVGGRCPRTGDVQFPRSAIGLGAGGRGADLQEDYPLADRLARIVSHTADGLTYSPSPPQCYGLIDFEGGGRMMAEFTDIEPEAVEIGRLMRMVFRIKASDEMRGFTKYFWKAAPADGAVR